MEFTGKWERRSGYGSRRGGGYWYKRGSQRRYASGKKGERSKFTVKSFGKVTAFTSKADHPYGRLQYLPVPVSKVVPPQDPHPSPFVSDNFRKQRKVTLTGATIEFKISYCAPMDITGVLYETMVGTPVEVEMGTNSLPNSFFLGLKEMEQPPRLLTVEETGFVDGRNGPYEVHAKEYTAEKGTRVERTFSLATVDGSAFECPNNKGRRGGPLGKVDWSSGTRGEASYKKRTGCVTANIHLPCPTMPPTMQEGLVSMPSKRLKLHWTFEKDLEFISKDGTDLARHMPIQAMFMVKSAATVYDRSQNDFQEAAVVEDMIVTVYYRS